MLFGTPLLIAAIPLGIIYASTKSAKKQVLCDALSRLLWLITIFGIFVSMAIKLFPPFFQQNLTDQMLFLPIALTFALQPVGLKEVLKLIRKDK
jgi:hypothetical protein